MKQTYFDKELLGTGRITQQKAMQQFWKYFLDGFLDCPIYCVKAAE